MQRAVGWRLPLPGEVGPNRRQVLKDSRGRRATSFGQNTRTERYVNQRIAKPSVKIDSSVLCAQLVGVAQRGGVAKLARGQAGPSVIDDLNKFEGDLFLAVADLTHQIRLGWIPSFDRGQHDTERAHLRERSEDRQLTLSLTVLHFWFGRLARRFAAAHDCPGRCRPQAVSPRRRQATCRLPSRTELVPIRSKLRTVVIVCHSRQLSGALRHRRANASTVRRSRSVADLTASTTAVESAKNTHKATALYQPAFRLAS